MFRCVQCCSTPSRSLTASQRHRREEQRHTSTTASPSSVVATPTVRAGAAKPSPGLTSPALQLPTPGGQATASPDARVSDDSSDSEAPLHVGESGRTKPAGTAGTMVSCWCRRARRRSQLGDKPRLLCSRHHSLSRRPTRMAATTVSRHRRRRIGASAGSGARPPIAPRPPRPNCWRGRHTGMGSVRCLAASASWRRHCWSVMPPLPSCAGNSITREFRL